MKKTRFWTHGLTVACVVALTAFGSGVARAGSCGGGDHAHAHKDLVDTAVAAGTFETLVAAVKAAGLVEALKGDGPLTVFAPTDEAFAKLPAGTVESLLRPENIDKLKAVLSYHVVAGRVLSKDAASGATLTTLQGGDLRLTPNSGGLQVNRARVISADVEASNGVIHVIDAVLMPGPRAAADSDAQREPNRISAR